jgi:putative ABC transport system ATP-binding protein
VPAATPYVRIRDLRFRYPGAGHDALVLPGVEVDRPGLIAITGPSGAGKSTLIELLAGTLNERYSGSVQVLGQEWSELRGDRPRQFHLRRIALIPQDLGLLPNQTPRQMLQQAMLDAGVARAECDGRMARALGQVELTGFADRRIAELSGGQKQRVAIARALVRNVELILADEPTANLHAELADDTLAVLRRIAATVPVLMVTHDPRMAERCDRSIVVSAPPAAPAAGASRAPAAAAAGPRVMAAAGLGAAAGGAGLGAGLGAAAVAGGRAGSEDRVSAEAAALPPMVSLADFGGPAGTAPPRAPRVPVARSPQLRPAPAPAPAARLAPELGRSTLDAGLPPAFAAWSLPEASRAQTGTARALPDAGRPPLRAGFPVTMPVSNAARLAPLPAGGGSSAASESRGGDGVVMPLLRKRSVLFASAVVCGVAAILGVVLVRPGDGTPAASKQPATAAAPAVSEPAPAASSVAAVLPPAAPTAPATAAPVAVHAATAARTTTAAAKAPVVPATASNPVTVSNVPMPVAPPAPAVIPSPAASQLTPFQQWMALFSQYGSTRWTGGTTAPTPAPSP